MKKLIHILEETDFDNWYKSWFKNYCRLMSKQQRLNMDALYYHLKEEVYHVHTDFS